MDVWNCIYFFRKELFRYPARRCRRLVAGSHRAGNWELTGRDEYSSLFFFSIMKL